MIMMTLPEDIWRHQSRQWQRWVGGWGWWEIVRPLSNCRRGRNPGSTGDLAFPWNKQFFCRFWFLFFLWGLHSEGALFCSAVEHCEIKVSKTSWCMFDHFYFSTPIINLITARGFQLKASTKIRDPGFPKKEVRHSNGHNSSWSPDTLAVVEQYCFLAILFHLL